MGKSFMEIVKDPATWLGMFDEFEGLSDERHPFFGSSF